MPVAPFVAPPDGAFGVDPGLVLSVLAFLSHSLMPLLPRSRWFPLAAAALLAGTVAACDDPFRIRASLDVVEDTFVVNSVSDLSAPIASPVAVDLGDQPNLFNASTRAPTVRRLGSEFYSIGAGFDFALDVQGDSVVFLPPRRLTTALSTVRRVGLRRDTIQFENAVAAPRSGYVFDTISVGARPGNTVFVVTQHPVCASEFSSELYGKVGIISIDAAARTATIRVRVDPNCGFRSFLPGVPSR